MASDDAEPQEEQQQQQQQEQGGKKPPGTWTPIETLHLIDAYQDKWYALKRGQLRTRHWDEVAESLAARCAGHPDATDKSSVQCRHKVEKLRRKYRAERQVFLRKGPGSSPWPFFERMDLMERGPVAAAEAAAAAKAALPFADLELHKKFGSARELQDHESAMSLDEDAEDSDQPPPKVFSNRKRRHHHHNPHQDTLFDDNDGSYSSFNRKHGIYEMPAGVPFSKREDHKNPRFSDKMGSSVGQRRPVEPTPFVELVSVIRSLGEGFLRMEQMKLQMQRETERFRADMEMRRTEMVLDSQKQIADLFTKALVSSKRNKKPQSPEN